MVQLSYMRSDCGTEVENINERENMVLEFYELYYYVSFSSCEKWHTGVLSDTHRNIHMQTNSLSQSLPASLCLSVCISVSHSLSLSHIVKLLKHSSLKGKMNGLIMHMSLTQLQIVKGKQT